MGYAIDDFQRRCLAVILRKVPRAARRPPLPLASSAAQLRASRPRSETLCV
jgi:hypothetical protein